MEFLATIVKVDKFLTSEKLPKWPLIWLWSLARFLWPPATPNQPPGQSLQKPKWMLWFPHTDSHSPSFTRQDSCFRGLHAKFLPMPTDQPCLSYVQRGLDLPRPPKSTQTRHFGFIQSSVDQLLSTCPVLAMPSATGALKGTGLSWKEQVCPEDIKSCVPITQLGMQGSWALQIPYAGSGKLGSSAEKESNQPKSLDNAQELMASESLGWQVCGVWQGQKGEKTLILVAKINNNKITQNSHSELTCKKAPFCSSLTFLSQVQNAL